MKRLLSILLLMATWASSHAAISDYDRSMLQRILYTTGYTLRLSDAQIQWLASSGVVENGMAWADSAQMHSGMLPLTQLAYLNSDVLNAARCAGLEKTAAYIIGQLTQATAEEYTFHYEQCDSLLNDITDNIRRNFKDETERQGWLLAVDDSRIQLVGYRKMAASYETAHQIDVFLQRHKTAISTDLRLMLSQTLLGLIANSYYSKPLNDVESLIKDINKAAYELLPEECYLVQQSNDLKRLWIALAFDPENHMMDAIRLQDMIDSDVTLNTVEKISSCFSLSNYNTAIGQTIACEKNLEQACMLGKRQYALDCIPTVIGAQADVMTLTSAECDWASPGDAVRVYNLLNDKYGESLIDRRAMAMILADFLDVRLGQTDDLLSIELCKAYVEIVEKENYRPIYLQQSLDAAFKLASNGKKEEAEAIWKQLDPKTVDEWFLLTMSKWYHASNFSHDPNEFYIATQKMIDCIESNALSNKEILLSAYADHVSSIILLDTHQDEVAALKPKIAELREALGYDKWECAADWNIALFEAKHSSSAKEAIKRYKEILERAIDKDVPDFAIEGAHGAASVYYAIDDAENARYYYDLLANLLVSTPGIANLPIYNEYLSFLYTAANDRVAWRKVLNIMVDYAEGSHQDFSIEFLNLLSFQAQRALASHDFGNAMLLQGIMLDKLNVIRRNYNSHDQYFFLQTANALFPLMALTVQIPHPNYDAMATVKDQVIAYYRQLRSVPGLFDNIAVLGADQCLKNRELDIYAALALDGQEKALELMAEAEAWEVRQIGTQSYKFKRLMLEWEIAQQNNDYDEIERIAEDPTFMPVLASETIAVDISARHMNVLTMAKMNKEDYLGAQKWVDRRYEVVKHYIDAQYADLSDSQRESLFDNGTISTVVMNNVLRANPTPNAATQAYNAALYFKTLFIESKQSLQRAVYASADSALIDDFNKLQVLRMQVNQVQTLSSAAPDNFRDNLKRLREISTLEESIRDRASATGLVASRRYHQFNEITKKLKKDEAAIEFIIDSERYGALIARNGDKSPVYVPLIRGQELDQILSNMHGANLYNGLKKIYLYRTNDGKKLYEELWAPLESHLIGIKTVYYSPEGALHKIAFAALQDSDRTVLCEKYDLRLVSSTGNIVDKKKSPKGKQVDSHFSCVAIGGIRYDADASKNPTRKFAWQFLPNTTAEIENFDSICNASMVSPRIYLNLEPSEEVLRSYSGQSPELMLLATHGFFFTAAEASALPYYSAKGLTESSISAMQRGGIILADANPTWLNERSQADDHDGVLTAEEIAQLDLSGTELMILSACDTGRGEIPYLHGVDGLQRGLKLAGVNSIVMSLWQVNDNAGKRFMTEFYKGLFSGLNRHDAFHQAQLRLHDAYPRDPAMWAPFIMLD